MKRNLLLLVTTLFFLHEIQAAPLYGFRVKFKHKSSTYTFADSLQYLSQRALDRRTKHNVALDSTDLPVNQSYISQTLSTANGIKIHNVSKWFNQVVVLTFDSAKVADIKNLPFVDTAFLVAKYPLGDYKKENGLVYNKFKNKEIITSSTFENNITSKKKTRGTAAYYGKSFKQVNITETDYLHDIGFRGAGMQIAVLDAGFIEANTNKAFDSLNLQNRLLGTWNFKRDTSYIYGINSYHGMNVLGCMAGIRQDTLTYVGSAPDASYYLFVTEDVQIEQPIEEDNWLSGAERADSAGVDLINSSLGYNEYKPYNGGSFWDYTYLNDFIGNKTLCAKAANKAWSKGIFVVNAMGNEGPNAWHYMLTPADADSIYSVGTVDSIPAWGGSGFGPSADGQIKPDGVTRGAYIWLVGANSTLGQSNGSSFASPNLCGGIACLMQARPNLKNWEIRDLIHQVSNRYLTPGDTFGYGIPNFRLAYQLALETPSIQYKANLVKVYPNPSSEYFNIAIENPKKELVTIKMYSIEGKLIATKQHTKQGIIQCNELSKQPKGLYFLQIQSGNTYTVTKVYKQ
jgi:hypothetical protein